MKYLSVCSGIEAAAVAWEPLGWQPVAFSETEEFPSAVLAYHYPDVPNHGDFRNIGSEYNGEIDLICGGTPCQSYSVSGHRKGMDDPRGNLAVEFIRLCYRTGARWVIWENVRGVLSSNGGQDFASLLSGFSGRNVGIPRQRRRSAGIVEQANERCYGVAWRVLDAQYTRVDGFERAVPQRRRRVFLVGYLGDWRRAAAVLFERESLPGNSPPGRKTGQDSASASGEGVKGEYRIASFQRNLDSHTGDVNQDGSSIPLRVGSGKSGYNPPAIAFKPHQSANARTLGESEHTSPTLTSGDGGNSKPAVALDEEKMIVRRLMPVECERLQGFPDGYTRIPWKGKPVERCPDSHRYRALGNAWAVNCARWIGRRIQTVEEITGSDV